MSASDHLSPAEAAELLSRQQKLQRAARQIIAELGVATIIGRAGAVTLVGSLVSGLMVWRDVDFNVHSPGLQGAEVLQIMAPLLAHPCLKMMRYRNASGAFLPPDPTDARFFYALYFQPENGEEWKIDVSFWVSPLPRAESASAERIAARLTDETRLAILWIKDVWHRLPIYPLEISGVDIYEAVLDHGVRTPSQFGDYLGELGQVV